MSTSAWRHYRPVRRCQSFTSCVPDDPNLVKLRYHLTGRCCDMLRDLAEVGSFPESHASPPANNNKRTYGSDEPAESPPPDNISKASPNGHGPIASSKRVSSSLASSPRGPTSVPNEKPTPPPIPTTSGTQEHPGDLTVLPVTGSASTSEKTDGLEIRDSPSPGALTRIFGGGAMPITTNDLGRLPLHHGVKFPTNFDFGQVAGGWNTTGSEPSPRLSQGGLNTRGTQAEVIPGLHPPQEQHPEGLFPWMLYSTVVGGKEVPTESIPTQQTSDRLDPTISSLFGDMPSPFTALRQTAGLLPGPTLNETEGHADLFNALFPPSDPPVGSHPPTTVQSTQQSNHGHEDRGYENIPMDAQAYLHGWSSVPQAFE